MTASENFWRMPKEKSEDLRSKPHDFYQKKIAQPQAQAAPHGSSLHFFYLLTWWWTKGLQIRLPWNLSRALYVQIAFPF